MVEKDSRELMVTIRCLVYNHEPYLRQCLDGFVMQQTNFRFEAIVHDDASTDGSAAIIREYAAKYPDIIKPIYETENQYSKRDGSIRRIMNEHTHGKYVAMCEGDDYWTDSLKLQKQVDFLESHPDFSMCTHRVYVYRQNSQRMEEDNNRQYSEDFVYDLDHFVAREGWITQTLSLLYRRSALDLTEYYKYKKSKDVTLIYTLLKSGKGVMLNELMGVYRIHDGGVWQGAKKSIQIKSDLDVMLAIYEHNRTRQSAILLRRSLYLFGFLGWPFFRKYFKTYLKTIWIIFSELGIIVTLKAIVRSLKFF